MGGLVTHVLPLNLKLDIISLLLVYVIKYIIKCSIHNKCNISFYKIVYLCVMPILFFASLKLAPCLTMKQLVHVSYTLASLSVHSLASQCRLHGTQSVCILYFLWDPLFYYLRHNMETTTYVLLFLISAILILLCIL